MLCLTRTTRAAWVSTAVANLDAVLADHAHCEMKAASNALSLAARVTDWPPLVRALAALAEEELAHFGRVLAELERRGIALGPPPVDEYAVMLRKLASATPSPISGHAGALVDRLLVAALIEARSCERFRLLAEALKRGEEPARRAGTLYRELLAAEARHYRTFVDMALDVARGDAPLVEARLAKLAEAEGELSDRLPCGPSIHG